ncbi:MAG: YihA family ribosome biogenesis GTP-binding protein [Agathobacter sp.]|nr:YihA family ribosome biogenesis GTP-binding protein [Agathobacter sp.]
MVIKNVNLETVCGITSTFPDNPHYEVAFAGKSNVGKSSLINALMNRKSLARTSSQPGKTQTINFYNINDAMYLVDLPGYGYANANVEIKAKWGKMIEKYLHTSTKLKAVFLLIDIRHEPSDNDCLMYEWMVEQGFAPIIIATKLDKISRGAVPKHMKMIADTLKVEPDTIMIPFSAETKQGREDIWELIDSLVLPEGEEDVADSNTGVGVATEIVGEASAQAGETESGEPVKQRKPRWKAEGKETAKKTKKLQEKKAVKTASKTGKKFKKK